MNLIGVHKGVPYARPGVREARVCFWLGGVGLAFVLSQVRVRRHGCRAGTLARAESVASAPLHSAVMRDDTARRLSQLHRLIYQVTRGLIGRRLVRNDMLLLTTRGRRTGRTHSVPLLYLRDGDALVVIASWGGRPDHPQWYQNLLADPRALVQVRSRRWPVRARTAEPAERARWWPRVLAAYHGYRIYESNTDRVIPVVFLEPEQPEVRDASDWRRRT